MATARLLAAAGIVMAALACGVPLASAQVPDESMDVEAHALFEAGRTAFAAGRFVDALGYFQHAYELSHRSELLYNVGQCQDRLRHDADALASFEAFLAAVPAAATRGEVESRVAILREAIAHTTATTTTATSATATPTTAEPRVTEPVASVPPVAPTPQPPPTRDEGPGAAPWVLVGVGAAVVVAGAILLGVGMADIASVQNAAPGSSYAAVRDAAAQAPILTGVGWASVGLGAALAIAGVAWAATAGGSGERVALRIAPGSVSLTGSF